MNSVVLLRHRRVLWCAVMAACLLSGFILTTRGSNLLWTSAAVSHLAQVFPLPRRDGAHFNPAASPNPQSRIPNSGFGPAAQPRVAEAYGKLPLSFEFNKGQTDSTVKFLSRGSGYSLFLTGNEAVLSLRKGNSNGKRQMAKGVAQGSYFNPAVFPGLFAKPEAHQGGAAFPAFFRTPTAEFTDSAPDTDCRDKDLEKPQGLKGEPCATQAVDALLRMKLVGANPNPKIVGTDELPGKSNYFIGNDPKRWRTNVSNYAKVKYANVYPGVDLVYYGNQGKLEYDFVVSPGADPAAITLAVTPASSRHAAKMAALHVDKNGDLVVTTDGGEVIFHKPVVYQPAMYNELKTTNGGGRDLVEGQYVLRGDSRIAFQLADYDRRRPVIIDPALAYSTYLGGNDYGSVIAVDAAGSAYVAGRTLSGDFPTTPDAFQTTYGGGNDAFVAKLNPTGSALVYSTYLGGSRDDVAFGIGVDASGNAYVTGSTDSDDFPTTPGAFQSTFGGVGFPGDVFVSKLSADGSALMYSTYLGGPGQDSGSGVAVDAWGDAYVTGTTGSTDFPTTPGAFQTKLRGPYSNAFVTKLNSTGSALFYSTYLGRGYDSGSGIAIDALGNAYVTGGTASTDFPTTPGAFQTACVSGCAFVSKLNAYGSALVYSTYLGGSGGGGASAIALDPSGNAYVTGGAGSDFPTTPGAFQDPSNQGSFVTKLNAAGSALVYSTSSIGGADIALDASGNAYVTGMTGSSDFPTTPGAFQTTFGGDYDAFVTKLNAAGSTLLYSTYLGGSGQDGGSSIAVGASGDAYVTGGTLGIGSKGFNNFPITPGAFQTTPGGVFVAKLSFAPTPVALKPVRLHFPLLRTVETSSPPQTVKLTNVGSGELDITGITVTGSDPGDFVQSNNCPATVAAAASCLITVTFTPTAQGWRTAWLSITDSAPGSPQIVLLTGRGTFLKWSPRSLNLGDQPVGTSTAARTVTLTNAGTASITLFSIEMAGVNPGDFSQTNTCGSSLNPGASCTIQVTFTPTAVGSRLGHVAIRDSAFGGTHWVGLIGKGT